MTPEVIDPRARALRVALELVRGGYPLTHVTLRPDGKGGKLADHHSAQWGKDPEHAVSTDPDVIRKWHRDYPDTSFAIVTGGVVETVDLDVAHDDEENGLAWWLRQGISATPPATMRSRTRSGGLHIAWRARADGRTLRSWARRIPGVALDVRGAGGLLYAPGAYLVGTDQHWRGIEVPAVADLDELPDRVLDLIAEHSTPEREEAPALTPEQLAAAREHARTHPRQARAYAEKALHGIAATIAAAPVHHRERETNDGALRMGTLIFHQMIDRPTVEAALIEAAMATGHTQREATDNVRHGLDDGIRKPGPYPNLRADDGLYVPDSDDGLPSWGGIRGLDPPVPGPSRETSRGLPRTAQETRTSLGPWVSSPRHPQGRWRPCRVSSGRPARC